MNSVIILELQLHQLILAIISLLFICNEIVKFIKREERQTPFKLIFTIFIWANIFIFSTFPDSTHILSKKIGFGENLNTLIFIGFFIVFIIIFKIVNMIEQIERNISEIVRKEALNRLNNKKNDLP